MFHSILPDDLADHNRARAEQLAAGLAGGAQRTEQAAVALMLRIPGGVAFRDDVWDRYVVPDQSSDQPAARFTWPDLAKHATSGRLPLERCARYLVEAACALANPMHRAALHDMFDDEPDGAPLHQLAANLDSDGFGLMLAALYHAAGRPDPAEQLGERDAELARLRRLLDAERIAHGQTLDTLAALRTDLAERADVEAVRGTEDGEGGPLPDGVDGHPVGHATGRHADDLAPADIASCVHPWHEVTAPDGGPFEPACPSCGDVAYPATEPDRDPAARIAAVAAIAPEYVRPLPSESADTVGGIQL